MKLYERMMQQCCVMDKTTVSDGEGGFYTEWRQGAAFPAAITMDTTLEAERAKKEGVTSVYKVTTYSNVQLEYNTYIKRLNDGAIFRITTNAQDVTSPAFSGLNMAVVRAEERGLPN